MVIPFDYISGTCEIFITGYTHSRPATAPPDQLLQLKIVNGSPAEAGKTTSLLAVTDIFRKFRLDEVIKVQTTGGCTPALISAVALKKSSLVHGERHAWLSTDLRKADNV